MTKTDKERIHRWITQADLERMLDDAYAKGAEDMRDAVVKKLFCGDYQCPDCDPEEVNYIRVMPLPKRPA